MNPIHTRHPMNGLAAGIVSDPVLVEGRSV